MAANMADRVGVLGITPDIVLVSSAVRARETADIFAKKLALSSDIVVVDPDIYEAERSSLLRIIHQVDDSNKVVMVIGHNPGVLAMVHHLVECDIQKMPDGAFAVLEMDAPKWRRVAFGCGQLKAFETPEIAQVDQTSWRWRFMFWRRQRIQKFDMVLVSVIGFLLIVALIVLVASLFGDPAGAAATGSAAQ